MDTTTATDWTDGTDTIRTRTHSDDTHGDMRDMSSGARDYVRDWAQRDDWHHVYASPDGRTLALVHTDDGDLDYANPREHDNLARFVHTRSASRYVPCEPDTDPRDDAMSEAWARCEASEVTRDADALLGRYVAAWAPGDVVYVTTWHSPGMAQSDWAEGIAYVTRDAMIRAGLDPDSADDMARVPSIVASEVGAWRAWREGEVYAVHRVTLGEPIVTYGPTGAVVTDHEYTTETMWGYVGREHAHDAAQDAAGWSL